MVRVITDKDYNLLMRLYIQDCTNMDTYDPRTANFSHFSLLNLEIRQDFIGSVIYVRNYFSSNSSVVTAPGSIVNAKKQPVRLQSRNKFIEINTNKAVGHILFLPYFPPVKPKEHKKNL